MVLPGPARLSVGALGWLLGVERIGEPHLVVAPTAVWRAPDEQDEHNAKAQEEIVARGWYDRRDRLEVEVGAALGLLCRAEMEFFGWITCAGKTIGVLAAGLGRHGLLAVRDGDEVWLRRTGRGGLAEALVAQTPDVPAGQGKPVMVPRVSSVRGRGITEAVVRVGSASTAVRRVREMVALPTTGSGELYAAIRDGMGRYRVSEPLRYCDSGEGRYLMLARASDQIFVAPAGRADVVVRLQELLRSITS